MPNPQNRDDTPHRVTDERWEDELRVGQTELGEVGSVEDELAVIRLLRHAAAPEELGAIASDGIWADIEADITPPPWWSRLFDWRVATGVATAAAAAAVIVLVWPSTGPTGPGGADGQRDPVAVATPAAMGAQLEAQFSILEGPARGAIAGGVQRSRESLRSELLARAAEQGGRR